MSSHHESVRALEDVDIQEAIEEASSDSTVEATQPPKSIPDSPNASVTYDKLDDHCAIGGGANADVTKATLPTHNGEVTLAIKEPRLSGTLHTDQVRRMLNEAETWDKLDDHDHIVGVVDYGSQPLPWIAMEYMDAGHLGERSGWTSYKHSGRQLLSQKGYVTLTVEVWHILT